jgi:TonB-linked SusC/RagA family outer membrane protein
LDYYREFNEKHSLTGMLLAERHMQQQQSLLATNYMGISGRLAYAFENRYFAEANFAYQGSEQFKKGNRFGLFPSLSLGWILTNEKFLENVKAIDFLKLRASVGQAGNSVYSYGSDNQYLYLDTWNSDATQDQLGNPSIKWETSTKYNIGVEAKLFNAFVLQADYFYNKNTDIILSDIAIIPDGMMGLGGASLPPLNLGEVTNQGFELVLGYNKQINRDLSVNMNGNLSYCKNERGYMAELSYDDSYAYPYRKQGYAINYNWGYRTAGLFNSQEEVEAWADQSALGGVPIPGDIKYLDLTGDNVVDQKDQAPIGIGQAPEISYGFIVQTNYKWFDLSLFFNGAARRNVYLHDVGRWSNGDNFTEYMKNAWTAEKVASGEEIIYPRLGKESTNFIKSDYWINDGSYVRLRNIELGFTLPERLSKHIKANSVRIYANGLNLFTWDKLPNDDFDPESANTDNSSYPLLKSYNFGVSVKF